ncbi:MAG TPA: c-type cytochrome [Xanthobacteraceae bacterium]|nr:c-type cytochrome [Xanthobacteraceae bacterium]
MVKSLSSFACAVVLMLAAAPVQAADDLEARLASCNACHGQNGQPINAQTPIIWGQTTAYLTKQIHDFHSEDRNSPVMSPLAQMIKPEEWRKAAAYFTAKPWPAKAADKAADKPGATPVAATGAPPNTALCEKCHQEKFSGGLPAPRLAGQSYEYLLAAMNSFADGTRTNSQDMATLMKMMSPADRDTMAKYIAGL